MSQHVFTLHAGLCPVPEHTIGKDCVRCRNVSLSELLPTWQILQLFVTSPTISELFVVSRHARDKGIGVGGRSLGWVETGEGEVAGTGEKEYGITGGRLFLFLFLVKALWYFVSPYVDIGQCVCTPDILLGEVPRGCFSLVCWLASVCLPLCVCVRGVLVWIVFSNHC